MADGKPKRMTQEEMDALERVYELEEVRPDNCPNCGEPLRGSDAILCVKCGFDLRTNRRLAGAHGDEEAVVLDKAPLPPHLCHPGRPGWKPLTIYAAVTLGVATILNGLSIIGGDADYDIRRVGSMLVLAAFAVAFSVIASIGTARMTELDIGDLGLATARICASLGSAALVWTIPWNFFASGFIYATAAVGVYLLCMRILFRKTTPVARKLLPAMHLVMMIIVSLLALIIQPS